MKPPSWPSCSFLAALPVLLLLLPAGCGQKSGSKGPDFSQANSVSVLLGEPDLEHRTGVNHAYWQRDGRTTTTTLEGKPCRHLKVDKKDMAYLYFSLDPSFKKNGLKDVLIELEYFDAQPGTLGLDFDATKTQRVPNAAYVSSGSPVRMAGSKRWQMAAFRVHNASFSNAQNGKSDFRFRVSPPELYLRRVVVTRLEKLTGLSQTSRSSSNYSSATLVSLPLGELEHESGTGLQHVYFESEGATLTATVDGSPCRHLQRDKGNTGYLYFTLDPTFKKRPLTQATIEVEYFDHAPGAFGIHFDSTNLADVPHAIYANARQVVRLAGTKAWQTASFPIREAGFKNRQNSKADFRIWVTPPEMYVRRVTVLRGTQDKPSPRPPAPSAELAKTNLVGVVLGEEDQDDVQGLIHAYWQQDGLTTVTNLNGKVCRGLALPKGDTGYFYFSLAPAFKSQGLTNALIEVEYLDAQPGVLTVEYDASQTQAIPNPAYARAGQPVRLRGTGTWQTSSFLARNPSFSNAQNAGADFRLCLRPPALFVHRVTVRRLDRMLTPNSPRPAPRTPPAAP